MSITQVDTDILDTVQSPKENTPKLNLTPTDQATSSIPKLELTPLQQLNTKIKEKLYKTCLSHSQIVPR